MKQRQKIETIQDRLRRQGMVDPDQCGCCGTWYDVARTGVEGVCPNHEAATYDYSEAPDPGNTGRLFDRGGK